MIFIYLLYVTISVYEKNINIKKVNALLIFLIFKKKIKKFVIHHFIVLENS